MMNATSGQINALLSETRSLLKKAKDTAWEWNPERMDPVEEQCVSFLIESAFRKSQMLFEMLGMPETLANVVFP